MKKQTNPNITFSICIASSIIFLALKLSGVTKISWILIVLPVILYIALYIFTYAVVILALFVFHIPDYIGLKSTARPVFTEPMHWDASTKQFYFQGEPLINEGFNYNEETGRWD